MQIQIFKFKSDEEQMFSEIRTVEIDGEVWFVATDVAKILGYKNQSDAISRHCKVKGIVKHDIPTNSGNQSVVIINEPNVFRLIVKSQLESAEIFESWLFDEVLPSIRKNGFYGKIDRSQMPNFYERYKDNYHKIDRNYFSVLSELFVTLNAELERAGYQIPNKGLNGQGMYPDISVGKMFSNYLKKIDSEHQYSFKTYKHSFPDGRPEVDVRMYPLEALLLFRKFIYEVWIPQNSQSYFKTRDPLALDYLPKLLRPAS